MEELIYARDFVALGKGIEFGKSGFCKARFGGEVTWKTNRTHTTAIDWKIKVWGKVIDWSFGGEMLIVAELKKHFVEWWIISENTDRIVIDV